MKAEYTGRYPGMIQITDNNGVCYEVDNFEISTDEARELLASLSQAILDAEEAKPTILPCPFCGGESRVNRNPGYSHIVVCNTCNARGPSSETWQEAIENWNRRP